MGATLKLSDTMNFVQPFVNWAQLAVGTAEEPFITSANLAAQTIAGPPFAWAWNREEITLQTVQGVQDYSLELSDYAFLEACSIQMLANISSVTVLNGVATFQAVNNFSALLTNGPVTGVISGCTTSALNGSQSIIAATPTTFTCRIAVGNLTESESGAKALAGPIMPLEVKELVLTDATEQDRPSFICELNEVFPPLLNIIKSHSGNFTQGQSGATFQVVVTNSGGTPTSGLVTVTETAPSGLTFVSMSGTGWSISGNTATRSDVLNPGASYPALTVTVNVASNASSPQVNRVAVSGGGANPASGTDSVVVNASSPNPTYAAYEEDCFFGNPINLNFTIGTPWSGVSGQPIKAGDIGFLSIESLSFTGFPSYGTPTDNFGNTYSPITGLFNFRDFSGHYFGMQFFQTTYGSDIPVGSSMTINTTYSPTDAGGHFALTVLSGVSTLNQVQSATIASGTTVPVPITITQPCVLIGGGGLISALPTNWQNIDVGLIGDFISIYKDPSTSIYVAQPGTYTPTWTNGISEANAAAVAAYNLA